MKNKKKTRRRKNATAAKEAFKETFKDVIPAIDNINEMIKEGTTSNERQVINCDDDS